jgi:hypothetical protein
MKAEGIRGQGNGLLNPLGEKKALPQNAKPSKNSVNQCESVSKKNFGGKTENKSKTGDNLTTQPVSSIHHRVSSIEKQSGLPLGQLLLMRLEDFKRVLPRLFCGV